MCGLFGLVVSGDMCPEIRGTNKTKYNDYTLRKVFKEGLSTLTPRGMDGTGYYTIPRYESSEVQMYKRALNVIDFFQLKASDKLLWGLNNTQGLVGHVRKTTVGSDTDDNTHPHTVGDITLVHNGTLKDYNNLVDDREIYTSDSVALCAAMNKYGVKKALERAKGAFAVAVYDSRNHKFYLCRNDERSLSFTYLERPKTLIWSSESKHLEWILNRNKLEPLNNNIFTPKPNVLIEVDLNDVHTINGVPLDIPEPVIKEPAKKKPLRLTHESKKNHSMIEAIENMGYTYGQVVRFCAYEWEPYKNSELGKVTGVLAEDQYDTCVAYSVDESVAFDKVKGDVVFHELEGTIVAMKYEKYGDKNVPVLVLHDVRTHDVSNPFDDGDTDNPDIDEDYYINGPDAELLTFTQWKDIAKKGCTSCGGAIVPADLNQCGYLLPAFVTDGHTGLLCPHCTNQLGRAEQNGDQSLIDHYCITN